MFFLCGTHSHLTCHLKKCSARLEMSVPTSPLSLRLVFIICTTLTFIIIHVCDRHESHHIYIYIVATYPPNIVPYTTTYLYTCSFLLFFSLFKLYILPILWTGLWGRDSGPRGRLRVQGRNQVLSVTF